MNAWIRTRLCIVFAWLPLIAVAEPFAYSVNSDQPLGDTLHLINLSDGSATAWGVQLNSKGVPRRDVEGLAIAPDLALWGIDEEQKLLFQVDTVLGIVQDGTEVPVEGVGPDSGNDFGMTFACNGELYISSVATQSLYTLDQTTGQATVVGAEGNLGVNISAIAAFGNDPVQLFGLGNGYVGELGPVDNRSLYAIDPDTGVASWIGMLGPGAADYTQAGLSFDANGTLWAITDRAQFGQGSQILQIDTTTGVGTVISTTLGIGFESLAAAPPAGCEALPVEPLPDEITAPIPTIGIPGLLTAILLLLLGGAWQLRRARA
ncbi:MAG: hypothetical protein R3348_06290 [Xanthomonadales bacterium]|nr:hypothetical protein [Xanthomonadales bacterium]